MNVLILGCVGVFLGLVVAFLFDLGYYFLAEVVVVDHSVMVWA